MRRSGEAGPGGFAVGEAAGMGGLALLRLGLRAQSIQLAVAASLVGALLVLTQVFPDVRPPPPLAVAVSSLFLLFLLFLSLVCYMVVAMAVYQRPRHPIMQLIRNLAAVPGSWRNLAMLLPALASLLIFTFAFGTVKGNIPRIVPFSWDETFDRWDTLLHFGRRPWEWLQPVIGHWPVTLAINVNYNLWFFVSLGVWMHHAAFAAPGERRTRYLLAFMLTWMIGGNLLAVLFSSAGPCYYGAGYLGLSPDPYAALMDYLRATAGIVPVWALTVQDTLWQLHAEGATGSISAMPSMHNAAALLFLLASGGWPRWVRRLLFVHFLLVYIGSVHLAWHYAVDAYAGWAVALLVWWAAGPLARRWENTRPAREFRAALTAR